MARRMQFSVVGLPHYTIWHLYEPSVDDLKHMAEMEREKIDRERQQAEEKEQIKKAKEEFKDISDQWAKDKQALQDEENKSMQEKLAKAREKNGGKVSLNTDKDTQVKKD